MESEWSVHLLLKANDAKMILRERNSRLQFNRSGATITNSGMLT
jgi:hypothetical protein